MTTSDILNNKKKLNQNQNQLKDKKNQQVTIRNTVINFNMIDTGIILPSFKKIKNDKKIPNLNKNIILDRKNSINKKNIQIKNNNQLKKLLPKSNKVTFNIKLKKNENEENKKEQKKMNYHYQNIIENLILLHKN